MNGSILPLRNSQSKIKAPKVKALQRLNRLTHWVLTSAFNCLAKSIIIFALLLSVVDVFAQFDNDPAPFEVWGLNDQHVFVLNGANPTYPDDVYYHYNPISVHGTFDYPGQRVTVINGVLYGVTKNGGFDFEHPTYPPDLPTPGKPGNGVIFGGFGGTPLYEFKGAPTDGKNPIAMTQVGNKLYGVTSAGGASDVGVIFEYDYVAKTYTKRFDFTAATGSIPSGALTLAANGKLYGLTTKGGANDFGVLYEFDPATGVYTKKLDFDGVAHDGSVAYDMTLAANNKLYGVMNMNPSGIIFEYDPATSTYNTKYSLNWTTDGYGMEYWLTHTSNGKLYGATIYNSNSEYGGVLFEFDYVTNTYTVKHDFGTNSQDGKEAFGVAEHLDGKLYGHTIRGGRYNRGAYFEFDPATGSYSVKVDYFAGTGPWCLPVLVQKQKITMDPIPNKTIHDGPFVINATGGTSGNPVVLTSSSPGVISISGNVATVVGYGITRITASQAGNDKYKPARDVEALVYVLIDQTITFDPLPEKSFGDAPFGIAATVSSNKPGTVYTSSDPNVATISGSTVTITGVGTTTITAYHSGSNTHIPVSATQDLTVIKGNQTITFDPLPQKTLGDAAFPLTATASSGLTLSYTSSNEDVATISGNTVTLVGPGTTTIAASQPGNVNYNPAADVQQTLTVKLPQAITFDALAAKTYGDESFTLTGTASSGLAVSYVSSNTSVATISGNTVTILSAGTTTIAASQAGNVTYDPAPDVQQVLTVNKKDQTITFDALTSKTFGDGDFVLTATASSGFPVSFASSNTDVAAVSGNTITIVGAGTTVITVSQSGDANHNAAVDVQQTLTVNKKDQTITFDALTSKTFGNAPFALTATASSGLAVSYVSSNTSVATVSGNTVTIVGAGTTTITASQSGDANHNTAADVQQILTVNKSDQTITFAALSAKTVSDAPFALTGTASSGLAVNYVSSNTNVATISGNTITIVGAGTTTITASQPGDENYNAAADVSQTLTVNKHDQTITFNALADKRLDDVPFALSATASSGLAVTYSSSNTNVATVSGSIVTVIAAGSTTITASQAGNASYNAATEISKTLTVRKLTQTITFPPIPYKTYGDAPFALTATASSGLPVTFEYNNNNFEWAVASLSGNIVTVHESGWVYVTAKQEGNDTYEAASVTRDLIVFVLMQEITFGPLADKTFGDAPFALTAMTNSGLPVSYTSSNTNVATVSGDVVTIVGAGTTTITARQDDFTISVDPAIPVDQTLTVNKADQTITFSSLASKTIGDASFDLTATATSTLPVSYASSNTSVATVSGNTVTIVGAGSTTITALQAGNANYNAATDVSQTLIVKANQTITFPTLPWTAYGDAPVTLDATSSSGLPVTYMSSNTNVATVSGNTLTIVGAGTTTITASQAGNANYSAAREVEQVFTVYIAGQDITFGPLVDKVFGDAPFELTASASSGLPVSYWSSNEDVATVSGNTVTIVGAGTTIITAYQEGNVNYDAADNIEQTLFVDKASQTVTFGPLINKIFGDASFTLTATASSGLPVSYSSSNTSVATISGNTVTITGAGTTTITARQSGNKNYHEAIEIAQTLTVDKASQTINFGTLAEKTMGDAAFDLTATASSGLAVNYESSNQEVATISGSIVTIVGAGTTTITALQPGNENYLAASIVSQSLIVKKKSQTIAFAELADRTIGDDPFDLTAIASSGLTVSYTSPSDKISISGSRVSLVKPGRASITASQMGDDEYLEAASVTRSFCIRPAMPTISFSDDTGSPLLTSSAGEGNQWFFNGVAIDGATGSTLEPTAPGIYSVQVHVDDCVSDFSPSQALIVLDAESHAGDISINAFPNPTADWLTVSFGNLRGKKAVTIFHLNGMEKAFQQIEEQEARFLVTDYAQGSYVVQVKAGKTLKTIRFVKK